MNDEVKEAVKILLSASLLKEKCPYTVYSSKDDEIWDVEIEKD